jgi:DNA ligase-4
MKPSELSFDTICDFLDAIANILKDPKVKKKYAERAKMIKGFMNHSIDRSSGEAFEVFRLIMPKLDTERGNYRLKEAALGAVFADAMNLKDTPKAKPLLEWTDPTVNATVAGNLSAIVEKVVAETARIPNDAPIELRKTMKVSDVNEKLDELVRTSGKRKDQANVLTYFVRNGTPRQCRYITQIILKNMKHGCGDKPFFDCWHPDAASYFDTHGMSIKSVFNNLKDDKPVIFSITPGKVVNPQLACTTFSAQSAIQKLQKYEKEKFGKDAPEGGDFKFLIETKFDGERIQVHRTGNEVQYFSRKAIDHGVRNKYTLLDEVILAATGGRISEEELVVEQGNNNNNGKKAASRLDCVLDGELIVWNKRK